jgi:hypothetical protein
MSQEKILKLIEPLFVKKLEWNMEVFECCGHLKIISTYYNLVREIVIVQAFC